MPQTSKVVATADENPSLVDQILRAMRSSWKVGVAVAVTSMLVVLGALFVLLSAIPTTTTYVSRFQFTFPQVYSPQSGERLYPNRRPFSINSVIDPVVLASVYDQLKLEEYGIRRDEFYAGFTIRPFATTEAEIAARYQQQLAERRLAFADRERIEAQIRSEMERASAAAAELSFTVRKRVPISTELGRAVVSAVPLTWSNWAIERQGVLRIPAFSTSQTIIAPELIQAGSLPLVAVRIAEADRRLFRRFRQLAETPGAMTALDPVSRKSVADLEREAGDIRVFLVNVLRDALGQYSFPDGMDQSRTVIQRSIRELELAEREDTKAAGAITETITQFVQSSAGLKGLPYDRRGPVAPEAGGATIPQVSESFIDRVMRLARSGREADAEQTFLVDLIRRQLNATERANAYAAEREAWQQLLTISNSDLASRAPFSDQVRNDLSKTASSAATELNGIWAAITRVEAEFAATRLDHTGSLYKALPVDNDVVERHPWWTSRILALALGVALLALLATSAIYVLSALLRPRRAPSGNGH
jgi:hypothetical protein